MIEIADAVGLIARNEAPLVCTDACALLDILRAPAREFGAGHVEAAIDLLERMEADEPSLNIVIMKQVEEEIGRNREKVRGEANVFLAAHDRVGQNLSSLVQAMKLPEIASPDFSSAGYVRAADAILDRFLASPLLLDDAPCVSAAITRLREPKTPAKRGKDSFGDCLIVEGFFKLISDLRTQGYSHNAVFLTTNTSDFADDTKRSVHPDLTEDFARLNAEIVFGFLGARFTLFPP